MSNPQVVTSQCQIRTPGRWRLLWSAVRIRALALIGVGFLTLINLTLRWKRIGHASDRELLSGSKAPKIVTFWHGCQLYMAFAARHALLSATGLPRPQMHTLISGHSDGRIIAFATRILGLRSVSGSSSKGGSEAVSNLIKCLNAGSHICITPDGPKGPIYKAKKGAIVIASTTGLAIWPSACAASHAWKFKSWDKMFLPNRLHG